MNDNRYSFKILYVEDEGGIREQLAEFLDMKIKNVVIASNGKEGLDAFYEHQPDMVITDIKMPVMNGLDMAREIKNINMGVPIIITTAYGDSDFLMEAIEIGINEYIMKPIKLDRLINAIDRCNEKFLLAQKLDQTRGLLAEYKNAIDTSAIVSKTDEKGIITYANNEFCRVSGYKRNELIGEPHNKVRHPDTPNEVFEEMWRDLKNHKPWKGIMKNLAKNGSVYYVSTTVVPIVDLNSEVVQYISISYEVTELIRKEEQLLKQLHTDTMTQLPNRRKLLLDIESSQNPSLILVNIDSFQEVNDFYGNEIGDRVLLELGNRLSTLIKENNYKLYKMPTDEYAILADGDHSLLDIEENAAYFQEEVSETPFVINDNEVNITVTVGIASRDDTDHNQDPRLKQNLPIHADMAMKKAKKLQKKYIVYNESLQIFEEYENNIRWAKKLKDAIRTDRIIPYFQPIVNNETGSIEKYECLVRMVGEDGSIISPIHFLNISKKTKLYHHITRIITAKSFEVFKTLPYEFSINLSVNDILDKETNAFLLSHLRNNIDTAGHLVFELLESEGIENYVDVKEFIREVKTMGVKIAIDDFGTGYSNFEYVMKLDVDYIKIDASMTKFIDKDKNSQVVTKIIADFAKTLNIKTISEFVSSESVYQKVKELGVDYSQGYFFGEPKSGIVVS